MKDLEAMFNTGLVIAIFAILVVLFFRFGIKMLFWLIGTLLRNLFTIPSFLRPNPYIAAHKRQMATDRLTEEFREEARSEGIGLKKRGFDLDR